MQLTADQQQLVVDHLRFAQRLATATRNTRCTLPEKISAAYLALCTAAQNYVPGGDATFSGYAGFRITGAVRDENRKRSLELAKRQHRKRTAEQYDEQDRGEEMQASLDPHDAFEPIDLRDQIEGLLAHFIPRDRAWLEAYIETGNRYEAATRIGCGKSAVFYAHRRIKARLAEILPRFTGDH